MFKNTKEQKKILLIGFCGLLLVYNETSNTGWLILEKSGFSLIDKINILFRACFSL